MLRCSLSWLVVAPLEKMGNACANSEISDSQQCHNFDVVVKTEDRPKSGTNAHVYIILHGINGKSKETKLDAVFRNDIERGQTDTYYVMKQSFDKIQAIELWRDRSGLGDSWNIDTITVRHTGSGDEVVFLMFRWIRHDYHYYFAPYDTSLPQHHQRRDAPTARVKC